MSKLNLKEIDENDIAYKSIPELMICLLVDNSYSMIVDDNISKINKSIETFINNAKKNPLACASLNLCIITCGGEKAKLIFDFKNITEVKFERFKESGGTQMCEAFNLALDKITSKQAALKEEGKRVYHPWLIVFSDGKIDDLKEDIDNLETRIQDMYKKRHLKGKFFLLDDKNSDEVRKLAPNNEVSKLSVLDIDNFLNQLSQSIASASITSASDEEDIYSF